MQILDVCPDVIRAFQSRRFLIARRRRYAAAIDSALAPKREENVKRYDFDKQVLPVIFNALN